MTDKILKCQFAGDATDPYCLECDGLRLIEGDNVFPATECQSYIPSEEVVEEPKKAAPAKKAPAKKAEAKKAPAKKDVPMVDKEAAQRIVDEEINGEPVPFEVDLKPADDAVIENETTESATGAVTRSISVTRGVTYEDKGVWHKVIYSEERTLNEICDLDAERAALWNDAIEQVALEIKKTQEI